jgi:hypothetical protein
MVIHHLIHSTLSTRGRPKNLKKAIKTPSIHSQVRTSFLTLPPVSPNLSTATFQGFILAPNLLSLHHGPRRNARTVSGGIDIGVHAHYLADFPFSTVQSPHLGFLSSLHVWLDERRK